MNSNVLRMTLKDNGEQQQLSCRARAFSVEALLQRPSPPLPVALSDVESTDVGESERASVVTCPNTPETRTPSLRVELCSRDLWRKFHALGTEMIITKAGRRMFPTVKARLHGLVSDANYIVFLDILPLDDKRYRYVYHSSQWTVAGAGDPPLPRSLYVHPDSPASGQLWMAQGVISFDKLKLTNNRRPIVRGQVSLHSMHKYQPRVHVLQTEDLDTPAEVQVLAALQSGSHRLHSFTFPETSFTTGFREASKTRDHLDDSQTSYHRLPPHFSNADLLGAGPSFLSHEFSPHTWPPCTPLSMPIKFVIPPSSSLAQPAPLLPPFMQQQFAYRPHFQECLRLQQAQDVTQLFFPTAMLPHRPPEALDLSTFK
ncbi:hypothetical protein B566_EDAN006814 [Ephemera danica]|nr:hypothetical protein B566_EDAN006814 [Ephemera danica]